MKTAMPLAHAAPYPVGLAGCGERAAWLASVAPGGERVLRLARYDADGEHLLHEAPSLHGLTLCAAAGRLALLAPDHVRLFAHPRERSASVVLPLAGVASLRLEDSGELWALRGTDLMHAPQGEPGVARVAATQVLAIARHGDTFAWARSDDEGRLRFVLDGPGGPVEIACDHALPARGGWRFDLCLDDRILALMVRPAMHNGQRARTVLRYARDAGCWHAPVVIPPMDHLGLRDPGLQSWRGGELLALVEIEDAPRVACLRPGQDAWQALTAPEHEVLDFRACARSGLLACTHVDLHSGAAERALSVGRGQAAGALRWTTHQGVAAAFALDGAAVHLLQRTDGHLSLQVDAGAGAARELWRWPLAPTQRRLPVRSVGPRRSWEGDGAPAPGRPVLAVVPGLHKLATPCLQTLYLQEFLCEVAATLRPQGVEVCVLQLPGSAGRGRAWREQVGAQDVARLAQGLREAVDRLAAAAAAPVGLLSASLGALGLLRALALPGAPAACALLAPVFSPAVVGWPADRDARSAAAPASAPSSRFLLLHGTRDEVAPWAESERFAALGAPGERQLVPLPGEGHIPAAPASWSTVARALAEFFLRELALPPLADPRSAHPARGAGAATGPSPWPHW